MPLGEGSLLTLEQVGRQHGGTYQCKAENGVRESVFAEVSLRVLCEWRWVWIELLAVHNTTPDPMNNWNSIKNPAFSHHQAFQLHEMENFLWTQTHCPLSPAPFSISGGQSENFSVVFLSFFILLTDETNKNFPFSSRSERKNTLQKTSTLFRPVGFACVVP